MHPNIDGEIASWAALLVEPIQFADFVLRYWKQNQQL